MILMVGLGNPGPKYKYTRHNIGSRIIDNLQLTIDNFSNWKEAKKFQTEISEGKINGQKVLLAKPQTFMNNSGVAVKLIYTRYKIQNTKYIFVIHDDIDLPLGEMKIVKNRGSAGHKGVESIIRELKTKDFVRFRIGIRLVDNKQRTMNNVEKFVLRKFTKDEEKTMENVFGLVIEAIETALEKGIEKTMNEFNK